LNRINEEVLGRDKIAEIQQALEDIKKRRVYPIESVAKGLGIKLC
jgi:hypothetical protein